MTEADISPISLICGANQWTGFYMMSVSIMKGLRKEIVYETIFRDSREFLGNLRN